jgi:hypothetical protein
MAKKKEKKSEIRWSFSTSSESTGAEAAPPLVGDGGFESFFSSTALSVETSDAV